jgi:hypothetical protein
LAAGRSAAPGLRRGPARDLGFTLKKDFRQRGVAVDGAFIEARQGSEAGTLTRYIPRLVGG